MKRALWLAILFPALAAAQAVDDFGALDLDGDRRVSLAEAAGNGAIVVRFDRADRDGDGKLSAGEFQRLKRLKVPQSWKEQMFASLDINRDGALSPREAAVHRPMAANFEHADADGDGRLSRREFARAPIYRTDHPGLSRTANRG